MSEFGKKIKQLRENKNKSQVEVGLILDIDQSALSKYERGKSIPGLDVAIRLADYFEKSLDWLAGRENTTMSYLGTDLAIKQVSQIIPSDIQAELLGVLTMIYRRKELSPGQWGQLVKITEVIGKLLQDPTRRQERLNWLQDIFSGFEKEIEANIVNEYKKNT